jgi:hypothetical protein
MLGRLDSPSGLCRTCRHVEVRLAHNTCTQWGVAFECRLRAMQLAPHASRYLKCEREPGSDDHVNQ